MTAPTGSLRKTLFALGLSILFCAAIAAAFSLTARVHAAPARGANATSVDDPAALQTFTGKIMSQNGVRFILRDDSIDAWYHLDDQQEAGKFLGKNVQVIGILDGPTDTIRVRTIAENKTENPN